jgi:CRP-like cAMP-binding protein
MVPLLHKPDDIIVLEGDKARYFYIIATGIVEICHGNLQTPNDKLKQITCGDYFGELSILFNCRRTCSVRSINYTTLARIESHKFLKSNRKFIKAIRTKTLDYKDKLKLLKLEMLKSIDYLEYHSYFDEEVRMFYDTV